MKSAIYCAVSIALVAACTVEEPSHKSEAPVQAPAAVPQPASAPAAAPLMSQDEADTKAANAISKENADAELEKLKKELSGG